jgi:arylamine N-acetyltransferase
MATDVTDTVDVAGYFDRIGYGGQAEPTVETLPPRSPTSWCTAAGAATATSFLRRLTTCCL